MTEEILPILERHAGGTEPPPERVLQIMHPYLQGVQADLFTEAPTTVETEKAIVSSEKATNHKDLEQWIAKRRAAVYADTEGAAVGLRHRPRADGSRYNPRPCL